VIMSVIVHRTSELPAASSWEDRALVGNEVLHKIFGRAGKTKSKNNVQCWSHSP
jgi:hypothetical protein